MLRERVSSLDHNAAIKANIAESTENKPQFRANKAAEFMNICTCHGYALISGAHRAIL